MRLGGGICWVNSARESSGERIRKFRLLEKELDHDDNEVTATMKVRRKIIYEKFAPIIREIYG